MTPEWLPDVFEVWHLVAKWASAGGGAPRYDPLCGAGNNGEPFTVVLPDGKRMCVLCQRMADRYDVPSLP